MFFSKKGLSIATPVNVFVGHIGEGGRGGKRGAAAALSSYIYRTTQTDDPPAAVILLYGKKHPNPKKDPQEKSHP